MKRVVITGADGFIGQHARFFLLPFEKKNEVIVIPLSRDAFLDDALLQNALVGADAVFHLAGKNRGEDEEIYDVNVSLTKRLIHFCESMNVSPHILFSSSTHQDTESSYGKSKRECARLLHEWERIHKASVTVFVLPHVFGEFAKPFYNSAVATICHQIAEGETPEINSKGSVELIYVQDVLAHFYDAFLQRKTGEVRITGTPRTLPALYEKLGQFAALYASGVIPLVTDSFEAHLFMTLHSYVFWKTPLRALELKSDERGELFEIVRHNTGGQVFYSKTVPGKTRGEHYHTRKLERFAVVEGEGEIRLRKIHTKEILRYPVSGTTPSVMDMPTYYTHSLTNTGAEELKTAFWINEQYNQEDPDTYHEPV